MLLFFYQLKDRPEELGTSSDDTESTAQEFPVDSHNAEGQTTSVAIVDDNLKVSAMITVMEIDASLVPSDYLETVIISQSEPSNCNSSVETTAAEDKTEDIKPTMDTLIANNIDLVYESTKIEENAVTIKRLKVNLQQSCCFLEKSFKSFSTQIILSIGLISKDNFTNELSDFQKLSFEIRQINNILSNFRKKNS